MNTCTQQGWTNTSRQHFAISCDFHHACPYAARSISTGVQYLANPYELHSAWTPVHSENEHYHWKATPWRLLWASAWTPEHAVRVNTCLGQQNLADLYKLQNEHRSTVWINYLQHFTEDLYKLQQWHLYKSVDERRCWSATSCESLWTSVWTSVHSEDEHHHLSAILCASSWTLQWKLYIVRMNITTCQQCFVHLHELYNGNCT